MSTNSHLLNSESMTETTWEIGPDNAEKTMQKFMDLFGKAYYVRVRRLYTKDLEVAKKLLGDHKEPNPKVDFTGKLLLSGQNNARPTIEGASGSFFTIGFTTQIRHGDIVLEAQENTIFVLQENSVTPATKGYILSINWD